LRELFGVERFRSKRTVTQIYYTNPLYRVNSKNMNLKYLVIVIGIFVVGGGVLIYPYIQGTQDRGVKDPMKKSEERLVISFDQTEYRKDDKVTFTLSHNTEQKIYLASRQYPVGGDFTPQLVLERYDVVSEEWDSSFEPFYPARYHIPQVSLLTPFLDSNDQMVGNFYLTIFTERLDEHSERYRLRLDYFEDELCGGKSYWKTGNQEFCDRGGKAVFSEGFIAEGIRSLATPYMWQDAKGHCVDQKKHYDGVDQYPLAADDDEDYELLVICWKSAELETGRIGEIFLLDYQENKYVDLGIQEKLVNLMDGHGSGFRDNPTFQYLSIEDIDGDGIEEVTFSLDRRGENEGFRYLYAPKFDEWFYLEHEFSFYVKNMYEYRVFSHDRREEQKPHYKIFKDFLLQGKPQEVWHDIN
jgi:hypothetical protein